MEIGPLIGQGRTAEIFAWGDHQILKLFRSHFPDSWAEHEWGTNRSVHNSGVRVPDIEDLIEIDGRKGIVYERIDGPTLLREMTSKPWRLAPSARLLAELHADMHTRSVSGLPRQRKELENRIQQNQYLSADIKEKILLALHRLPDESALCHGDFHPDNVLSSTRGNYIIDWTSATQGNPLADVANTSLLLQLDTLPPGTKGGWFINLVRKYIHQIYLKRYFQLRPEAFQSLQDWMLPIAAARLSENIPSEKHQLLSIIEGCLKR